MTSLFADRVARLETTNRVLLVLVGLLIVLAFLGFRFSQPASATETVSAKAFRLVDGDGKTLAELKQGEKGPGLFILDNEGKERLAVTHEADQTGLFVFDEEGQVRVGAAQLQAETLSLPAGATWLEGAVQEIVAESSEPLAA